MFGFQKKLLEDRQAFIEFAITCILSDKTKCFSDKRVLLLRDIYDEREIDYDEFKPIRDEIESDPRIIAFRAEEKMFKLRKAISKTAQGIEITFEEGRLLVNIDEETYQKELAAYLESPQKADADLLNKRLAQIKNLNKPEAVTYGCSRK